MGIFSHNNAYKISVKTDINPLFLCVSFEEIFKFFHFFEKIYPIV